MKLALTDEQRMVVNSEDKNILLIAGAGTGKTRVLTERLKKLLESGVDPQGIVTITYTNLATNEIKERLKNVEGIDGCFIGTIHSFANSILKSMNMYFKVLTDAEYIKIAEKLIKMYCKKINIFQFIEIKQYYDKQNNKKTLNYFSTPLYEYEALCGYRNVSYIPTNIYSYADENNYITFKKMIELATEKYKSNFIEHLLVDEFQDVGTLEYEFIKKLDAKNNFFVGDDWQSIYSFSGANVNIMLDIYKNRDFKNFMLTKNFRNPKQILDTGRKLIDQLEDYIEKDNLCMNNEYDGKVVIDTIHNMLSYVKDDVVILTRTNKDVEKINNILTNIGFDIICLEKSGKTQKELDEILKSNKIKIMTIHQSKGLEFNNVIIYGKEMKIDRRVMWRDNDEEKRIMYVAITRAKKELIILN